MIRARENLTVAEVAEMLGVHAAQVLTWIRRGELVATNVSATPDAKRPTWRIASAAVDAFRESRESRPQLEAGGVARPRGRRRRHAGKVIEFFKH
jgi:excisionase family DNA binding protein